MEPATIEMTYNHPVLRVHWERLHRRKLANQQGVIKIRPLTIHQSLQLLVKIASCRCFFLYCKWSFGSIDVMALEVTKATERIRKVWSGYIPDGQIPGGTIIQFARLIPSCARNACSVQHTTA